MNRSTRPEKPTARVRHGARATVLSLSLPSTGSYNFTSAYVRLLADAAKQEALALSGERHEDAVYLEQMADAIARAVQTAHDREQDKIATALFGGSL
jgi:hypothetical protein